jgi:DNA-binding Lrp family transcriptional regulator
MAKSNTERIQEDTLKILAELQKNAKENIDTIAKRCGFSRQKVWKAIKQMEADQMIWGYTAIFDEKKIGQNHFILMLKRSSKQLKEGTTDRIISRRGEDIMSEIGGTIETSAYVHGDYDWFVTFNAKDIIQAKKYSDTLTQLHPGEIEKITLLQTLLFIKKQYILNPDRKKLKDIV